MAESAGAANGLQASLQELLPTLVGMVPREDFPRQLALLFAPALGCSRWIVVRYGVSSVPHILWNTALPAEAVRLYGEGLYRIDVIYRLWREQRQAGVFAISRDGARVPEDRRYARTLQAEAAISDELALLLPLDDDTCVAICWDRETDCFGDAEVRAVQAQQPLLHALLALHVRWQGAPAGSLSVQGQVPAPPLALAEALAALPFSHELTEREREIIGLIIRACPNALIASRLGISVGTVRNHRSSIYYKLDITSERELLTLLLRTLASAG